MRGRRRSPRGRVARGHHRRPRPRGVRGLRRTRTDRPGRDPAGPKARRRTRRGLPAPTGHRDHPGVRSHRDPDRRARRAHPGPTARRRTAVPAGSARRDGSPGRGGSSGSRTRHRRRRTAEAAAGSGAPGSRRRRDRRDRHPTDRGRRVHPDRDPAREPGASARQACTSSPCWSGSSTGTPRRRARRPRGACGTAGRVPARRRGAGVHRDPLGPLDLQVPGLRDPPGRPRREAGEGSRAAGNRNRRPEAAVEAAGVRHRPYGDRRPRTSRRNPTGVRSGRSACRRFPLSFPASRPVPVAATGRCGRFRPDPRWGSQALCSGVSGCFQFACSYFFTRTVFVDRVSRVISSASVTFAFSRTVPVAASTTSTTFASSFAVSAFPEALAS